MSAERIAAEPMLAPNIAGPPAWIRDELTPAAWLVPVTPAAIDEIDAFVRGLGPELRPPGEDHAAELPACAALMAEVRARLEQGCGLAVLDRLPVERWDPAANRVIGWVLAGMLGRIVAQKWDGTTVYDVLDTGRPLGHGVRRSVTNLGQPFHTDGGWLSRPPHFVGLFCLQTALEGGISRFVSLVTVHNLLRLRHPSLLSRLYRPFHWDRQAEHTPGDLPHARRPVYEYDGGRLAARWYEDYIAKGQALAREPLDAEGVDALAAMAALVDAPEHWTEFRIEAGQFQYLNNLQFAHCRTAFADGGPEQRRHLLRFWNRDEGAPELEGEPSA